MTPAVEIHHIPDQTQRNGQNDCKEQAMKGAEPWCPFRSPPLPSRAPWIVNRLGLGRWHHKQLDNNNNNNNNNEELTIPHCMELETRRIDGRKRAVVIETTEVLYDANDL